MVSSAGARVSPCGGRIPRELRSLLVTALCFAFGGAGATAICGSWISPFHHLIPAVYFAASIFAVAWVVRAVSKPTDNVDEILESIGLATIVLVSATVVLEIRAGGWRASVPPGTDSSPVYDQPLFLTSAAAVIGICGSLRWRVAAPLWALGILRAVWRWILILFASCSLGAATALLESWVLAPGSDVSSWEAIALGVFAGCAVIPFVYLTIRNADSSGTIAGYTALGTVVLGVLSVEVFQKFALLVTPIAAILLAFRLTKLISQRDRCIHKPTQAPS